MPIFIMGLGGGFHAGALTIAWICGLPLRWEGPIVTLLGIACIIGSRRVDRRIRRLKEDQG